MNAPVSFPKALWRGFTMKCPNCGQGHLFGRFLKVVGSCEVAARITRRNAQTTFRPIL